MEHAQQAHHRPQQQPGSSSAQVPDDAWGHDDAVAAARTRALERQLCAVTRERDDLAVDVQQLCMARGSSMFSGSTSERVKLLDGELKRQRALLRDVTAARDSLQEDMLQVKAAKKKSDSGWQAARQQAASLSSDLAFFKAASADAITERDAARYSAKALQADLDAASRAAADAHTRLASQAQALADARSQLQDAQQAAQAAQAELGDCRLQLTMQHQAAEQRLGRAKREAEGRQLELTQLQGAKVQLSADLATARATAGVLERALLASEAAAAAAQGQLEQLKANTSSLKQTNTELHLQLQQATAQVHSLQALLEQTSAALVASQARLKATHSTPSAAGEEVAQLKSRVSELECQLQQAARDKLELQLQLSAAQADEDECSHVLQQLQLQYSNTKVQLARATQEKVEALLKVANTQAAQQQQQQQQQQEQQQGEQQHITPLGKAGSPVLLPGAAPNTPASSMQLRAPGSSGPSSPAGSSPASSGVLARPPVQLQVPSAAHEEARTRAAGHEAAAGATAHAAAAPACTGSPQAGDDAGAAALACLQQALVLAHTYRTLLQRLKPADVAAAAAAAAHKEAGKARRSKGKRGGAAAAGPDGDAAEREADPLAQLAAAADGVQAQQQQVLSSVGLREQQQLVHAVAGVLAASCDAHTAAPRANTPDSASGSGSMLASSCRQQPPQAGAEPGLPLPTLHAALQLEVLLLAECGVTALRYIPRVTALSSLVQGGW